MIFCNENRALIKEVNPEYGFKDIARALSEGFKSLTEEEKIPFETKASADKERYRNNQFPWDTLICRYTREMKEYLENSKSLTPLGETPSRTSLPPEIIFPLVFIFLSRFMFLRPGLRKQWNLIQMFEISKKKHLLLFLRPLSYLLLTLVSEVHRSTDLGVSFYFQRLRWEIKEGL